MSLVEGRAPYLSMLTSGTPAHAAQLEAYELFMGRRLAADTASVRMLHHLLERSRREEGGRDDTVLGTAGLDALGRFVSGLEREISRGGQLDLQHYRGLCRELDACDVRFSDCSGSRPRGSGGCLDAWQRLHAFVRYDRGVQFGFFPEVVVCWIAQVLRTTATLDPADTAAHLLATRTLHDLRGRAHARGHEWLADVMNPYINKPESFAPAALEWFEYCCSLDARL